MGGLTFKDKNMNDKEIAPLKKEIASIAKLAEAFEIQSSADMVQATTILSQMNKYADSMKEKKELLTKPLNEALKNARSMFKPLEELYEDAIENLRGKMTVYQTEAMRLKKEEEQKIAMRVKAGSGNLSVETAVKKIAEIAPVEKEVSTTEGLVQFRESKILKIIDQNIIPREYLTVNETLILKDLKAGKNIAGVELDTIQVPVNYR